MLHQRNIDSTLKTLQKSTAELSIRHLQDIAIQHSGTLI